MIFTDRTIIVQKGTSSINDTIILYRGDKGVEIRFTLNEGSPFRFGSGASPNIIEKTEAAYGQLVIKTPNDLPSIFSEVAPTNEGKIVFTITAEMIDEITEVGNYTFQIRLFDESRNSRATLPEVVNGIEIRDPIASEDTTNEVGVATVGYALTTAGVSEDAFDTQGNYNKTTWATGDRITASKLNKIEDGIDGVNQKVANFNNINDTTASTTTTYSSNKIENIKTNLSSQIKDIANNIIIEDTGFKATTLNGILQEIYNALSNNGLLDEFKITTDSNIPEVYFTGDTSTMSKEKAVDLAIRVKINNFEWTGVSNTKWQGSSSLAYDKKNFTIKLYEDSTKVNKQKFDFNDWGKQNKFVLKANYIDHSHARNIISARIWSDIVASRSDYSSLPEELRNSPNNGAIDGFPVKVTINDVYQGLYTLNIPKDTWTFNMDDTNSNHAVLCAELNNNGSITNDRVLACEFRGNALIDGTDWSLEIPDILNDDIKISFNNLINLVKDSTDNQFKYNIGNYLDVKSAIDYYIFQYFICGLDGLAKNLLMVTYDGTKWLCSAYDMDSTFGLYYDGSKFVSNNYQCPEQYQDTNSLLWQRLETIFANDIKSRYAELRESVLSVENIISKFTSFMNIIGDELYAKDLEVYNSIPQGSVNHLQQISDFITARAAYVDVEISNLVQTEIGAIDSVSSITIDDTLSLSIPSGVEMIDCNKNGVNLDKEIYNTVEASKVGSIVTNPVDIDLENYYNFMTSCQSDVTKTPRVGECNADGSLSFTYKIAELTNLTTCLIKSPKVKVCEVDTNNNAFVDSVKLFRINKSTLENSITQVLDSSYVLNADASGDVYTISVENLNYGDILIAKSEQASWSAILLYKPDGTYDIAENTNTTDLKFIRNAGKYTSFGFKVKKSMYDAGYKMKYTVIKANQFNDLAELTATITPLDATNQEVAWTSSNENVVIIEGSGLSVNIKALKAGNADITCTSLDTTNGTISATCNVTVSNT